MKRIIQLMWAVFLSAMTFQTLAIGQEIDQLSFSSQQCLRFEDALKLSAQRDPSVIIARAQESEADADIKDARSLFRPQVSAFGRSGFGDTGVIDSSISNQVGVRAAQRIFDFGDAKYARQAAHLGYEASLEDTRQARFDAASQTGFSFLEFVESKEQIDVTRRRRDYFLNQLRSIDTLLETGAATRTERASVASQLADAEAFVLELEFRQEQALTRLQIDTGTAADLCTTASIQSVLTRHFQQLDNPESARQYALANSPSLKALEKQAERLEAIKQREKRSRLPVIDVVATGSYSSIGGFDQFAFRDRIGVDVSVPLYSGDALSARTQRASARQSIARGQVLDTQRQIRKDVSITYRRILSLQSQLESRQEVEKQAMLQFEAAKIEQKIGTKTLRDLIEIRLDFERAGLERIRTQYDLMRQQLQLLVITSSLEEMM
jgi:protease secretion system outer membrane protein